MPTSPAVVLATVGAIFLLVGFAGRIQAKGFQIGLTTVRTRVLAVLVGIVCLGSSLYVDHHEPVIARNNPVDQSADAARQLSRANASLEGTWNVTTHGSMRIVWRMKSSLDGSEFYAHGSKIFVEGQPATSGERETTLLLRGKLVGLTVKGTYYENQPTRDATNTFQLDYSADGMTFSGIMFTPDGRTASRFDGVRAID